MSLKAKSYAKINLFLKIEGYKEGYHQLNSRFMKVKNIYDEIEIREADKFDIVGNFDINLHRVMDSDFLFKIIFNILLS